MVAAPQARWNPQSDDEPADVAILTVIPEEFEAVKARLVDPVYFQRDGVVNTHAWHTSEVPPLRGGRPYRVVLAMAGRGAQAPSGQCASATLARWRPRYALLVGIAGGFPRDGLQKGDVVLSQAIFAYQYGALRDGRFQPRHDYDYLPDDALWSSALSVTDEWTRGLVAPEAQPRGPRKLAGNVASGDILVDDRSPVFWKEIEAAWERLLAVEMEGAAAAHAAKAANSAGMSVGFLMVRGISDMPPAKAAPGAPGEVAGGQERERADWKPYASNAAAAFAVHWIRSNWPLPPAPRQRPTVLGPGAGQGNGTGGPSMTSVGSPAAAPEAPAPSALKDRLRALHAEQLQKVGRLGLNARSQRPRVLSDIVALGAESIRGVVPSFRYREADTGSWIASHSLPMQLLTQSHLTVDLMIDELEKERPFGIPFESLFSLTEAGFLYLNLRDYDSDEEKGFAGYCGERAGPRVERLLKGAPGRIYVGSALRKSVFDAALEHSGYERSYEDFYKRARADLAEAYECYKGLPDGDPVVKASLFRGKRPPLVAICWHWAFLSSVAHYLPADIIRIDSGEGRLNRLYAQAAGRGDAAHAGRSEKAASAAADALAELATQLRIGHLNFTAPMTASYGTTYNMTDDEYRESLRLGFYWEDRAASTPDDDLQRLLFYAVSEMGNFEHPSFRRLRELPDDVALKETIDDQIFTTGTVDALIGALVRNQQRIADAGEVLLELKRAYLADDRSSPRRLARLIDEYRLIKAADMQVYRQALEKDWHELAERKEGGVAPVMPWMHPMVSEAAEGRAPEALDRLLLRPVEHRAIYRVYRALHRDRDA